MYARVILQCLRVATSGSNIFQNCVEKPLFLEWKATLKRVIKSHTAHFKLMLFHVIFCEGRLLYDRSNSISAPN